MERKQKRRRRAAPRETDNFTAEVRSELDQRIAQQEFKDYRQLKRWLGAKGCQISTLAVKHHALKLEEKIAAVRVATEQARAMVAAGEADDGELSQALMQLVQQHLFTLLIELKTTTLSEIDLGSLARTVSTLARATIAQKRYADEIRANVLAAQRTLVEAEAHGLTDAGVSQIKRILMEITN